MAAASRRWTARWQHYWPIPEWPSFSHARRAARSCPHFTDWRQLALFSTYAQFGAAEEVALSDMKIELMFPADAETGAFLLGLDQDDPGPKG